MRIIRLMLLVIGVLAIAMGLLWIGQGTGLVMWPTSSFMLADRSWAVNGAILAMVGGIIVWLARRRVGH
jgi:membrane protein implicated in regulation of membrane protease activity